MARCSYFPSKRSVCLRPVVGDDERCEKHDHERMGKVSENTFVQVQEQHDRSWSVSRHFAEDDGDDHEIKVYRRTRLSWDEAMDYAESLDDPHPEYGIQVLRHKHTNECKPVPVPNLCPENYAIAIFGFWWPEKKSTP